MNPAAAIEASFMCSTCGKEAARLVLVPRGGYDRTDLLAAPVTDSPQLVIDARGFTMRHALLPGGGGRDIAGIAAAIADGDIVALWQLDREYVPMWCPRCAAVYCADEWTLWPVYADDDPSWFEELRGRCPAGHERQIYD